MTLVERIEKIIQAALALAKSTAEQNNQPVYDAKVIRVGEKEDMDRKVEVRLLEDDTGILEGVIEVRLESEEIDRDERERDDLDHVGQLLIVIHSPTDEHRVAVKRIIREIIVSMLPEYGSFSTVRIDPEYNEEDGLSYITIFDMDFNTYERNPQEALF